MVRSGGPDVVNMSADQRSSDLNQHADADIPTDEDADVAMKKFLVDQSEKSMGGAKRYGDKLDNLIEKVQRYRTYNKHALSRLIGFRGSWTVTNSLERLKERRIAETEVTPEAGPSTA